MWVLLLLAVCCFPSSLIADFLLYAFPSWRITLAFLIPSSLAPCFYGSSAANLCAHISSCDSFMCGSKTLCPAKTGRDIRTEPLNQQSTIGLHSSFNTYKKQTQESERKAATSNLLSFQHKMLLWLKKTLGLVSCKHWQEFGLLCHKKCILGDALLHLQDSTMHEAIS